MKKKMIKCLVVMIITSIALGIISYSLNDSGPFSNIYYHVGYIIGYVTSFALILIIVSYLIAFIPRLVYWFTGQKHAPRITILAWSFWIIIAVITLLGLIYQNNIKPVAEHQATEAEAQNQTNAKSVYNKVSNSVYMIYSKDQKNKPIASGGAVAVTESFLATNCHIINGGDHFTISNGSSEQTGQLYSQHGDLCIIDSGVNKFTPVEIRRSKTVDIGEDVYAVGNPEGLEKSMSKGIISNKYNDEGITILQTDAAISPGSSGGGLFDHNGKLIGITTRKWVTDHAEGIGFVIPTETIEAAILEPTKYLQPKPTEQNNNNDNINSNSNPEQFKLTSIGIYGESKIGLMKTGNLCIMAIPGRSKEGTVRSLIIWTPYRPNMFFIFPSSTSPEDANNILSKYFTDKYELILTQNYLVLNNTPYQLSGPNTSDSNYQLLTIRVDKNPIKLFIDAAYFIILFTDKYSSTGYSTDYYGLRGFSEALAEYHGHCE